MSLRIGAWPTSPDLPSSLLDTSYREEIKEPVFSRRHWRWDRGNLDVPTDRPSAWDTTSPFDPDVLNSLRQRPADVMEAANKAAIVAVRDYVAKRARPVAGPGILVSAIASATTKHVTFRRQKPTGDHYAEAVRDLEQVREDAIEDGWPEPNDVAIDAARKLLDLMHEHFPQPYSVYPSHNGGVCLQPPGGERWSFLVICEPDGKILCSADRPRRPWQVRFPAFDRARGSGLILKALHDNCLDLSVP